MKTKLESLNAWLSLLANLGVIAGIVFVGLELRQANRALRGATYEERANLDEEWQKWAADSEFVLPAVARWQSTEFDSLALEDQMRLRAAGLAALYRLDGLHFQHEIGLMTDEYYDGAFAQMLTVWVPRWREFGLLEREILEVRPSFRAEIEAYLDGPLVR